MTYTLVIGNKNLSSWSLRPWLALKTAGVPFAEIQVRLDQPETRASIAQYSAAGKVPVLKIEEDGKTLTVWDSLAICETIAERHPDAQLWPADPAARALARSYAAEMHSGFVDVRQNLPMDFARRLPTPVLDEATNKQVARIINAWETALADNGGDFLFGTFSIADCMYAPVVSRFVTYGIDLPAASAAYVARMMALPALKEWQAGAEAELAKGWRPVGYGP
jgi:glutathione S-transferase